MKYQRIEDMRIDQDLTIKEISALPNATATSIPATKKESATSRSTM